MTIASGLDVVVRTDAHLPDVIVIDLAVPRIDGFETIRQLKAHPSTSRIPMVALSGLSGEHIPLARAAGADVCLAQTLRAVAGRSRHPDAAGLAAIPPVRLNLFIRVGPCTPRP